MNRKMQLAGCCFCWCFLLGITSAVRAQKTLTRIQFVNTVGAAPLSPDSSYMNAFGESFTVRQFKYYISHLQAGDSANVFRELSDTVLLVDAVDPTGNRLSVRGIDSRTRYLRFLLGVDSIQNVTGVHTGTLDPARGMFWTWNSGYIMAKLEGKSAFSKAPGRYLTYHVGGYKPGEVTARWITLHLPTTVSGTICIGADILPWFKAAHEIRIADYAVCHAPGNLAVQLADNYATMFSVLNE